MKNNEKKSYNRVQKDNRDFDALFHAEIDAEARERRRQRTQKRKETKESTLVGALIKASKFSVPKNPKDKEEGREDQTATPSLLFHVEKAKEAAHSGSAAQKPSRQEEASRTAAHERRLARREARHEASRLASQDSPTIVSSPALMTPAAPAALSPASPAETPLMAEDKPADMPAADGSGQPAAPLHESDRPAAAAAPQSNTANAVAVVVQEKDKPAAAPLSAPNRKEPLWGKALHFLKSFHAEFTDKDLIAKLREEKEDSYNMFAEIKESLENTPVDAIDVQSGPDEHEQTGAQHTSEAAAGESPRYIQTAAQKPSSLSKESDIKRKKQETGASEDAVSAAVEKLFSEAHQEDALQETGAYHLILVPEVAEAMKEIDYEHVIRILDPKFAAAVNRLDDFLDAFPQKVKARALAVFAHTHILPERSFHIKKEKFTIFYKTGQHVRNVFAAIRQKGLTPAAGLVKKGAAFIMGKAAAAMAWTVSGIRSKCAGKSIPLPKPIPAALRAWPGGERGIGIISSCSVLIVCILFAAAAYIESLSAYEVYFMESSIGIVKEKKDVLELLPGIVERIEKESGVKVTIDESNDFYFEPVSGQKLAILNEKQILSRLNDINKINVSAYALVIDQQNVALLSNREEAESVLTDIKGEYLAGQAMSAYESVTFSEDVRIVPTQAKMIQIGSVEEVKQYLLKGTTEEKIHTVQAGETLSGIAKNYGIKTTEIVAANPDVNPTKLQISQKISLIAPKPFVTVQTKELSTYLAEIPFEIKYEETQSMFKGETTVKSTGQPGEKEVVAEIIKKNGVEVSRVELTATTIKEPVSQVVIKGAKPLPLLLGTGSFSNPVRGKLSSRYGQRWSRQHEGVDISAPKGTTIEASDGGTITYAGYDGAYGNTVRINHGGNKTTVYAHMTQISVKEGQKVAKGQQIGTVGTTGRSTGPHLHFEVRVQGKAVNPLQYVNY